MRSLFLAMVLCPVLSISAEEFQPPDKLILRPNAFAKIKVKESCLSDEQRLHREQMAKMLSKKLCFDSPINYSDQLFFPQMAKKLCVKCDLRCRQVLTKLFAILPGKVHEPCLAWACQPCQKNSEFILENALRIRFLVTFREAKKRWFKKRYLLPLFLLALPVGTYIFRNPLSKWLSGPGAQFLEKNLPWILPWLAALLAILGLGKIYPKVFKEDKPDRGDDDFGSWLCRGCSRPEAKNRSKSLGLRMSAMEGHFQQCCQMEQSNRAALDSIDEKVKEFLAGLRRMEVSMGSIEALAKSVRAPEVGTEFDDFVRETQVLAGQVDGLSNQNQSLTRFDLGSFSARKNKLEELKIKVAEMQRQKTVARHSEGRRDLDSGFLALLAALDLAIGFCSGVCEGGVPLVS